MLVYQSVSCTDWTLPCSYWWKAMATGATPASLISVLGVQNLGGKRFRRKGRDLRVDILAIGWLYDVICYVCIEKMITKHMYIYIRIITVVTSLCIYVHVWHKKFMAVSVSFFVVLPERQRIIALFSIKRWLVLVTFQWLQVGIIVSSSIRRMSLEPQSLSDCLFLSRNNWRVYLTPKQVYPMVFPGLLYRGTSNNIPWF